MRAGQYGFGGVQAIQGAAAANAVALDPNLYPPQGSTGLFLSDSAALVGAGSSTRPAGLQITLTTGSVGVIDTIDMLADGIVISTQILFTILINGAPVPGFNNLSILGRNGAQSVGKSMGPFLRCQIPIGGTLQMQFTDVDGGAITMGAQLRGWYWAAQRSS